MNYAGPESPVSASRSVTWTHGPVRIRPQLGAGKTPVGPAPGLVAAGYAETRASWTRRKVKTRALTRPTSGGTAWARSAGSAVRRRTQFPPSVRRAGPLRDPQRGRETRHLKPAAGIANSEVLRQSFGWICPMTVPAFLQNFPDMAKGMPVGSGVIEGGQVADLRTHEEEWRALVVNRCQKTSWR